MTTSSIGESETAGALSQTNKQTNKTKQNNQTNKGNESIPGIPGLDDVEWPSCGCV
jgi:hypothetical protein